MTDIAGLQEVGQLAAQVGFPVVAFYLIYDMAKNTIKENTAALVNIRLTLEKVCTKLDRNNGLDQNE